jgi:cytochrome c
MTKSAVIPGRRGAAFAFAVVMAARPSVAADAVRGQQLYVECIACHSLAPGIHGIGPSLHGVFNRQAGVLEGFRYSPALRRSGIIWTADTLDAFIADSQKFLPGNRMPFAGMPEAADRADLIAYLQQAAQ